MMAASGKNLDVGYKADGVGESSQIASAFATRTAHDQSNSLLYEPLAAGEIRLLRLTSREDSKIEYELEKVDLDSAGDYLALSYVWGDSDPDEEILLNGKVILVRPSLFTALKAIQKSGCAMCLWIDALCINQDSVSEKSQQIPMMDRIFGGAHGVLIWMNDMADIVEVVFETLYWLKMTRTRQPWTKHDDAEFLEYSAERLETGNSQKKSTKREFWFNKIEASFQLLNRRYNVERHHLVALRQIVEAFPVGGKLENALYPKEQLFPSDHPFWTAFFTFLDHEWFWRVWTLQEVLLARVALVLFQDGRVVHWRLIRRCRSALLNPFHCGTFIISGCTSNLKHSGSFRDPLARVVDQNQYLHGPSHLGDLLFMASHRGAKIAKDQIYGLLGLVDEQTKSNIIVDYSVSDAAVFAQTVILAIKQEATILPLLWERHWYAHAITNDLPSWCPDFGVVLGKGPFMEMTLASNKKRLREYMQVERTLEGKLERKLEGTIARTEHGSDWHQIGFLGIRLDTIVQCAPKCPCFDHVRLLETLRHIRGKSRVMNCFGFLFGLEQRQWLQSIAAMFADIERIEEGVDANLVACLTRTKWEEAEASHRLQQLFSFCKELGAYQTVQLCTVLEVWSKLHMKRADYLILAETMSFLLASQTERHIIKTSAGKSGVSARQSRPGDNIIYVPGGSLLHVLSADCKQYVGCASVNGLLDEILPEGLPRSRDELGDQWGMFWVT